MKEFIEKLIEGFRDCTTIEDYGELFVSLDEVENIVNEFSKEYSKTPTPNHPIPIDTQQYIEELERRINNNDFCEWKFDTTGNVWNCKGCETYNLPYAMNLRIIADDFECKCPWCGKKIKVVE